MPSSPLPICFAAVLMISLIDLRPIRCEVTHRLPTVTSVVKKGK